MPTRTEVVPRSMPSERGHRGKTSALTWNSERSASRGRSAGTSSTPTSSVMSFEASQLARGEQVDDRRPLRAREGCAERVPGSRKRELVAEDQVERTAREGHRCVGDADEPDPAVSSGEANGCLLAGIDAGRLDHDVEPIRVQGECLIGRREGIGRPEAGRQLELLGDDVEGDHLGRTEDSGELDGEQTDGTCPCDSDRVADAAPHSATGRGGRSPPGPPSPPGADRGIGDAEEVALGDRDVRRIGAVDPAPEVGVRRAQAELAPTHEGHRRQGMRRHRHECPYPAGVHAGSNLPGRDRRTHDQGSGGPGAIPCAGPDPGRCHTPRRPPPRGGPLPARRPGEEPLRRGGRRGHTGLQPA